MIFDNVKRSRPHQSCKENQQCSVCKSTSSMIRLRWVRWDCDGKQGVWYFHALMVPVVSIILPRNAVMNFLKYLDREASSVASQLILIKVFILGPWSPGKMLQWVQMIEPQIPFLPESKKTLTSGTRIHSATWLQWNRRILKWVCCPFVGFRRPNAQEKKSKPLRKSHR